MVKKIEEYLIKKTKEAGGVCLKWQNMYSRMTLDRLLFLPGGRIIVAETKQKGGRMRPGQKVMVGILEGLGFRVEVLWNREDVDNLFENL